MSALQRFIDWWNKPEREQAQLVKAFGKMAEVAATQPRFKEGTKEHFQKELHRILNTPTRELELELLMPRTKVTFKTTDGVKPRQMQEMPGKPVGLFAPMPVNLPYKSSKTIKLGVTCDLPVLVCGKVGAKIFHPGQELEVTLEATAEPVNLGTGELVAKAFVFANFTMDLA